MLKLLLRFAVVPLSLCAGAGQGAEMKLIAANAVKEGVVEIIEAFEKSTGHKVAATWSGTVPTEKRLFAGDVFDVIVIGSGAVDRLVAAGTLANRNRVEFAKTGIAIAARNGLANVDVSTSEAIKAAVLGARSVAYSAGPSGAYIGDLFKRWGIADRIADKVKQPSSGVEVAQVLSRGEADLAFAQASEFRGVTNINPLGPLPADIQNFTIYSAAQHAQSVSPGVAEIFLKTLHSPASSLAIRKMGMEPE